MLSEVWVEVVGFPDYAVSNTGRVQHVRYGHDLRPKVNSYGYHRVSLRRDGDTFDRSVHHLVAQAFLSGYYPGVTIKFVDEDRGNNNVENLRFRGGHRLGRLVRNSPKPKYRRVKVIETGDIFKSVRDCARYLEADASTIYKVLRGERPSHVGHTFEFVEEH